MSALDLFFLTFLFLHIIIYFFKINELKKIHQAGGRDLYIWQKQPGDAMVSGFAAFLMAIGTVQLTIGYYRLATGKGKMD